ncbi:hypothetical protein EXE57_05990 [Nocardioides euryhalodurans]|uniref:Uncharacterized protein n=1 Tax=Nocardioides euryhalodurans TaxID=2518370 RepID=A0A4P7GQ20_9ACTN|nr:hypothetical protein EXE57_05990 [Nocardioides euryhalodurans]
MADEPADECSDFSVGDGVAGDGGADPGDCGLDDGLAGGFRCLGRRQAPSRQAVGDGGDFDRRLCDSGAMVAVRPGVVNAVGGAACDGLLAGYLEVGAGCGGHGCCGARAGACDAGLDPVEPVECAFGDEVGCQVGG